MMQALRGFENDMLVINEEWEREKVPKAIGELMRDLMVRPAVCKMLLLSLTARRAWASRRILIARSRRWTSANWSMCISQKA